MPPATSPSAALKQSFTWWSFAHRGVDASALLAGAARIGYSGVELIDESLWPAARDHGLTIASAAGHGTIEDGLNRRENAPRILDELRASLAKAVAWRIPVLICFSGNRPPPGNEKSTTDRSKVKSRKGEGHHRPAEAGHFERIDGNNAPHSGAAGDLGHVTSDLRADMTATDAGGLAIAADTLARIAPEAEQAGVTLAVELLNSRVDHAHYQCDRTAWGVELCQRVNSPAVRLLYDIYHMQIMEGDIIRTIRAHHRWFAHYHTAGNPGRGPLDGGPDATSAQELNYPAIFRAIRETGYAGFVGHEFFPAANPLDDLARAHALAAAR